MSHAQESRGERKGRGGWIFIFFLLALGVAGSLSGAGDVDWQARLADLRNWWSSTGTSAPLTPVKPAARSATPPAFDVAYAQPTGQLVIAGRGEPGWTVKIESDGAVLGEVTADRNGEWVFNPEAPLAPGEHSLSLSSTEKASGRVVDGSQRIALSIAATPGEQPVVALSDTDKATRLLQGGEKSAPGTLGAVTFDAVDYEKSGKGGRVLISGHAAPGARVMLYINNGFVGVATAGSDGVWSFAGARDLPLGSHKIRADMVPSGAERVAARAEVNFERADETRKAMTGVGEKKAAGMASIGSKGAPEASGDEGGKARGSHARKKQSGACDAIVVQRGDTLWSIAERCYGSGERFTKIFRSNKGQIRDPDMIYPDQRFVLP
jgi:nucleoid-associated protein YgaU